MIWGECDVRRPKKVAGVRQGSLFIYLLTNTGLNISKTNWRRWGGVFWVGGQRKEFVILIVSFSYFSFSLLSDSSSFFTRLTFHFRGFVMYCFYYAAILYSFLFFLFSLSILPFLALVYSLFFYFVSFLYISIAYVWSGTNLLPRLSADKGLLLLQVKHEGCCVTIKKPFLFYLLCTSYFSFPVQTTLPKNSLTFWEPFSVPSQTVTT